jgi:hypothetical protein
MRFNPFTIGFILTGLCFLSSFVWLKHQQEQDDYYVFADNWIHGIPTGFMGEKDGKSMKVVSDCTIKPFKGDKCVSISVDKSESWRGLHIQFTGAWNVSLDKDTPLADLSGYDKLEFYARTDETNEPYILTEVGVGGGGASEDMVNDTYLEVENEWKKFTINLKGADFKKLNTMMYMSLPTGTLYLDEIKFTKKKK